MQRSLTASGGKLYGAAPIYVQANSFWLLFIQKGSNTAAGYSSFLILATAARVRSKRKNGSDTLGLEQIGSQITLPGIAENHHNCFAASKSLGELKRGTAMRP